MLMMGIRFGHFYSTDGCNRLSHSRSNSQSVCVWLARPRTGEESGCPVKRRKIMSGQLCNSRVEPRAEGMKQTLVSGDHARYPEVQQKAHSVINLSNSC